MTSDTIEDDCCAGSVSQPGVRSLEAVGRVSSPLLSGVSALVVAFFPKCPMCWAAYLSMFGIAGADWLTNSPWLLPLFVLALVLNVGSLWWLARRRQRPVGFYVAALGALTILAGSLWLDRSEVSTAGIALTFAGSLLSVVSRRVGPRRMSLRRVSSPPRAS